jgi:RND family efflux transporter MFP subunit
MTPLRLRRGIGLVALLAALAGAGCSPPAAPAKASKLLEVVVTKPITAEFTDYQEFTGRLEAVKTVDMRARVTGYVQSVPFKDGDEVHEGDLLFQIDPQTYEADLKQAEANIKLAEADRQLYERNVERARRLMTTRAANQEDLDTNLAAWRRAGANIEAMTAARDRAKLYLGWTRVTAPVTGRISRRYVDPGNLVKADDTMLTTIVTEDPLYVYFDVDERTYLDLLKSKRSVRSSWLTDLGFTVLLRLANEEKFTHRGTIDFLDNRVNATSGTIRMRGQFPNPKGHFKAGPFKAGLFARIQLPTGDAEKVVFVPDEALLSDQGKKYVYVVTDKDEKGQPLSPDPETGRERARVLYRPVQDGRALDGLRVIRDRDDEGQALPPDKCLSPGERVIVEGMQRVRAESIVTVKMKDPPPPPKQLLTQTLSEGKSVGGDPGADKRGK